MRSPQDTVASRLRQALDTNPHITVRELARRLIGLKAGWSDQAEIARRNVYKWMSGTLPETRQQAKLARVFDLPRDHFKPSELEVARAKEQQAEEALKRAREQRELLEAGAAAAAEVQERLDQQSRASEEDSPRRKPAK